MKIHFDVLVLTALPLEWNCVGRVFDRTPSDALEDGPHRYFAAQLPESFNTSGRQHNFGRNMNIGVFCAIRTGNHQMAAVTAELIEKYSPSLVLLVGISAGRKSRSSQFGDVIVPGMILDFSTSGAHGKTMAQKALALVAFWKREPVKITYALRNVAFTLPDKCRLATSMVELGPFNNMLKYYTEANLLPANSSDSIRREPKFLDGVLASANILSRAHSILEKLASFNEQVRGTEMEAAGFATACERAHVPWAVGKAISDWGDGDKIDVYHQYAATTSACWARCLLHTCIEHGMIFEQRERFSAPAKLKAIQSMLAYVGARIESHNPLLKMNIQVYRIRMTRVGQVLTLENGWSYHGDPGFRSSATAGLQSVPVAPSNGKDLCICVAARSDTPNDSSSIDRVGEFYFSEVEYSRDDKKYPEEATNKVSRKQRWVVAYAINNGSDGYVLSHAGSNCLFLVDKTVSEKSTDPKCVVSFFQQEWKVVKPVLMALLDSNA